MLVLLHTCAVGTWDSDRNKAGRVLPTQEAVELPSLFKEYVYGMTMSTSMLVS